jgi:hypothetical protein
VQSTENPEPWYKISATSSILARRQEFSRVFLSWRGAWKQVFWPRSLDSSFCMAGKMRWDKQSCDMCGGRIQRKKRSPQGGPPHVPSAGIKTKKQPRKRLTTGEPRIVHAALTPAPFTLHACSMCCEQMEVADTTLSFSCLQYFTGSLLKYILPF